MLFPGNMGEKLSIDETSLFNSELYTVITNKVAKSQKGVFIAMIKGTQSDDAMYLGKVY